MPFTRSVKPPTRVFFYLLWGVIVTVLIGGFVAFRLNQESSPLVTSESLEATPDLERRVGQRVVLEGIVTATKCPQVQGVDAWELHNYRGQRVRVTGILRKTVITQTEIDALTPDDAPAIAHRGAGAFYSLDDMKYELLK